MSDKITSVTSEHYVIYFTLSSFTGNYHLPDVRKMVYTLAETGLYWYICGKARDLVVESAGNEIRSKVSPSFWRRLPSQNIFRRNLRSQNVTASLFPLINNRLYLIVMAKKNNTMMSTLVANCDNIAQKDVEGRILTIRGQQVIIDRDLAGFYGVETKTLNQAVKRNLERFPMYYRFQLTKEETDEVVTNCDHLTVLKYSPNRAYAFTERGVAMLSAVLHSPKAVKVSIRIMDAFVAMRHFLVSNAQVFQRLDRIELKQLETDHKIEQVFEKLEEKSITPKQGIFFDGQIYDAYEFVCELIKSAKSRIVLIDNYVDDTVLTMLDKRDAGVSATIYTQKISSQLQLDIAKHNAQYQAIDVRVFTKAHDRFLILDNQVYLFGASLKDLGKKWFAVSLMSETDPEMLLSRL